MRRVCFVAGNIAKFDVTPIQILRRMFSLRGTLEKPILVGCLEWYTYFDGKKRREAYDRFGAAVDEVIFIPRIPFASSLILIYIVLSRRCTLIHAIGYHAMLVAVLAATFAGRPLVFEMHGLAFDENVLRGVWHENSLRFRVAKRLERFFLIRAHAIIVVSNAFAGEIRKTSTDSKIVVCPCAVDDEWHARVEDAQKGTIFNPLQEKFVVVYSGTFFSGWEDPEDRVDAFRVVETVTKNAVLMVLTPSPIPEVSEFLSSRLAPNQYKVLNLSPDEVPQHLQTADLGLLLRKPSIVNMVSSPMKFAEYMAAGVPVLISENVGDASIGVSEYALGAIVPQDLVSAREIVRKLVDDVRQHRQEYRMRCVEYALNHHTHRVQREHYLSAYEIAETRER